MKKKIFAGLFAVASVAALASCGSSQGKVLNIYCWNNDYQKLFRAYYPEYDKAQSTTDYDMLKDGTKVYWRITANEGNAYQDKLDGALKAQKTAAADDKVDMFLFEADYALKYVNSSYSMDVNKLGIKDKDTAQMYSYTKEICTDSDGKLKGLSWQATPGLFAYRRSIAKDVLGTDDPVQVQTKLADWTKFDTVAASAKEKGYTMLSGYDDSYRCFSNNISAPLVNADKKIVLDAQLDKWVEQTKRYTDAGYNNKTTLWADNWKKDQSPTGKTFGFFYSTWGINFTLKENSIDATKPEAVGNGNFGDWAVCEGPAHFYWGGTWLAAAEGTDNKDLVKDIMYTFTCDKAIAKKITLDTLDYTNHIEAMEEIANDKSYGSAFLGGQNHIALFASAAKLIKMDKTSPYDQGINEKYQEAFHDYFAGSKTKAEALASFYDKVAAVYPALTH